MYDDIAYSKDDFKETQYTRMGIRRMYDDIAYSKDDFKNTQYTRMGIRRMQDDIAYMKDDIYTRCIYDLECAINRLTVRREEKIF